MTLADLPGVAHLHRIPIQNYLVHLRHAGDTEMNQKYSKMQKTADTWSLVEVREAWKVEVEAAILHLQIA